MFEENESNSKKSRVIKLVVWWCQQHDFEPFCKYCDVAIAGITADTTLFGN